MLTGPVHLVPWLVPLPINSHVKLSTNPPITYLISIPKTLLSEIPRVLRVGTKTRYLAWVVLFFFNFITPSVLSPQGCVKVSALLLLGKHVYYRHWEWWYTPAIPALDAEGQKFKGTERRMIMM